MAYYYDTRTACDVFYDIEEAFKALNFGAVKSLIAELRVMVNRMDAALDEERTLERITEELHEMRAERDALQREIKKLKNVTS